MIQWTDLLIPLGEEGDQRGATNISRKVNKALYFRPWTKIPKERIIKIPAPGMVPQRRLKFSYHMPGSGPPDGLVLWIMNPQSQLGFMEVLTQFMKLPFLPGNLDIHVISFQNNSWQPIKKRTMVASKFKHSTYRHNALKSLMWKESMDCPYSIPMLSQWEQ